LAPFTLESKLQGELVAEAATVLDAFGRATDPVGVREGLALAALLGRRSAEVGASAVEVAAMLEALLEVLVECLSPADRQGLRGLVIDGYTRAHLEREREAQLRARVRATRPFLLAPRVVMHVLQGSADGDWVGAACESLGPALLRADARALVVVAQLDGETSDACLAELCALVDLADVVGARVIIVASEGIAFEVIVVDDHATDHSRSVVEADLAAHPDVPMVLLGKDANEGLAAARNTGFAHCRADYVFVLDADNAVDPSCIAQCAAAMRARPEAAFAYPIIRQFGAERGLLSAFPWRLEQLKRRNVIDAMALVRRSAWAAVGGYRTDVDAEFGGLEDWALWLAFAERGWPGVLVPRVLARYRCHPGSMINATILNPRITQRIVGKFPGLNASP
jgi:hypothetical protein